MNWKQFLKPDWRKIVIFILLFIVFSFAPIWTTIRCSSWECGPGPTTSSFFGSLESMSNKEFFDFGYFTLWFGVFLGSIVISYILSFIVIFIYDKSRGKK